MAAKAKKQEAQTETAIKPDTKTAHTPGPWTIRVATASIPTTHLIGPSGQHLASFRGANHAGNAAMAAAAPDLLAALKDCSEILFHLGTAGNRPSQDKAIDAVRERALAAIAKATGSEA